jgi:hypothetical protein
MWDFVVLAIFFAVLVLFVVWASRRDRRGRRKPDETKPAAERHRHSDGYTAGNE